jgi:hypothetical protein
VNAHRRIPLGAVLALLTAAGSSTRSARWPKPRARSRAVGLDVI